MTRLKGLREQIKTNMRGGDEEGDVSAVALNEEERAKRGEKRIRGQVSKCWMAFDASEIHQWSAAPSTAISMNAAGKRGSKLRACGWFADVGMLREWKVNFRKPVVEKEVGRRNKEREQEKRLGIRVKPPGECLRNLITLNGITILSLWMNSKT